MPIYTYRVRATGEIVEYTMKMAEKDSFTKDHPLLEPVITYTNPVCDSVRIGVKRIDGGMRDVLRGIKKANPRSTIQV